MAHRATSYIFVTALALWLTACGQAEEASVEETDQALQLLEAELSEIDDVSYVSGRMSVSSGVEAPDLIRVFAELSTADETQVVEVIRELAERTWHSGIPRISSLTIDVVSEADGRSFDTSEVFSSVAVPAEDLESEFGPRDTS